MGNTNNNSAGTDNGEAKPEPLDFIREIVAADLASGKHASTVTRFPPEPNGYLHIGHAKSICLNFGISLENEGGVCHLRFDDTNPAKEDVEYVDSIKEDVQWLGFDWGKNIYFASDYFEKLYGFAVELIQSGKAFVCELTLDEIAGHRGTPTKPGTNSPYRDRSPGENLELFQRMRDGEFADGTRVLRAKIDMASPNLHMRDPVLYRIRKTLHHRTGNKWCLYPMYDFTHCLSDSIEGITHSLCTLEFEVHRPLYDWVLDNVAIDSRPRQIEFARLSLTYTVLSKRKLLTLVEEGRVNGWDDPRMPTVSGLRRRGYTPASIRSFCKTIGITKFNSLTDVALLEHSIRQDLNDTTPRRMAVLRPLKVVITNFDEDKVEELEAANHPKDPEAGTRSVPFTREIYVERADFMEEPPRKFFRLGPGREVRLRFAYFITCNEVIKNAAGEVTELHCTYDPETHGGNAPDGRKVKGTIHWVSASHAFEAQVRLYDRLFTVEDPNKEDDGKTYLDHLNAESLEVIADAKLEPGLAKAEPGERFQFERLGYFCADAGDSQAGKPVFNRTVTLRDAWAKQRGKG
ncbi:MAG TPA: glutamine--tRNA ligase/YqeY domain fusion protein [Verrucomicrobia bacterium]|nr:glutamine--tRNA ligase/YqeY domain fusion protein [Verrucomicrobiota bacterium]